MSKFIEEWNKAKQNKTKRQVLANNSVDGITSNAGEGAVGMGSKTLNQRNMQWTDCDKFWKAINYTGRL